MKEKIENKSINDYSDYSVYVFYKINTTDVWYVGMTNSVTRRMKEHKYRYPSNEFGFSIIATGLSKNEARVIEQALISAYTLDALKKLNGNKINSISRKKWNQFTDDYNRVVSLISSYWG